MNCVYYLFAAVAVRLAGSCLIKAAGLPEPLFVLAGVLGGATNARAWSSYLDFLFHGVISNYTETHLAHWNIGPPVARYNTEMIRCLYTIKTPTVNAASIN